MTFDIWFRWYKYIINMLFIRIINLLNILWFPVAALLSVQKHIFVVNIEIMSQDSSQLQNDLLRICQWNTIIQHEWVMCFRFMFIVRYKNAKLIRNVLDIEWRPVWARKPVLKSKVRSLELEISEPAYRPPNTVCTTILIFVLSHDSWSLCIL